MMKGFWASAHELIIIKRFTTALYLWNADSNPEDMELFFHILEADMILKLAKKSSCGLNRRWLYISPCIFS